MSLIDVAGATLAPVTSAGPAGRSGSTIPETRWIHGRAHRSLRRLVVLDRSSEARQPGGSLPGAAGRAATAAGLAVRFVYLGVGVRHSARVVRIQSSHHRQR
jgi:hypothetical protein